MREIGRVQFVQIQRESLKFGEGQDRHYNPSPILVVDEIHITREGIYGVTEAGQRIIDVHHEAHPGSRNRGRENAVSIGFTAHYDAIRDRFGSHLSTGIAGENIIIDCAEIVAPAKAGDSVVVHSVANNVDYRFASLQPAPPCVEFSRFAITGKIQPFPENDRPPAEQVKATLQFLDNGIRGYYAVYPGAEPAIIRAGDILYAVDD